MKIENVRQKSMVNEVGTARKSKPATTSHTATDFEQTQQLEKTLATLPDARPEQVARARALIADPNYPSNAQMNRVAGLLAANWSE